jgi:Leucine-rich repeat (LRR) protein
VLTLLRYTQDDGAAAFLSGFFSVYATCDNACVKSKLFFAWPQVLNHSSEVRDLNLDHNILTTIPTAIGSLVRLSVLRLSHNKLKKLPDVRLPSTACSSRWTGA